MEPHVKNAADIPEVTSSRFSQCGEQESSLKRKVKKKYSGNCNDFHDCKTHKRRNQRENKKVSMNFLALFFSVIGSRHFRSQNCHFENGNGIISFQKSDLNGAKDDPCF